MLGSGRRVTRLNAGRVNVPNVRTRSTTHESNGIEWPPAMLNTNAAASPLSRQSSPHTGASRHGSPSTTGSMSWGPAATSPSSMGWHPAMLNNGTSSASTSGTQHPSNSGTQQQSNSGTQQQFNSGTQHIAASQQHIVASPGSRSEHDASSDGEHSPSHGNDMTHPEVHVDHVNDDDDEEMVDVAEENETGTLFLPFKYMFYALL